jgi:hypothetical protein
MIGEDSALPGDALQAKMAFDSDVFGEFEQRVEILALAQGHRNGCAIGASDWTEAGDDVRVSAHGEVP